MTNERTVIAVIRAARPSFRNDHDKVAFAVHATFLSAGFVLTATGPAALGDGVFSSTSTDEVGIDNWNQFEDHYAFVYTNPEKGSKKVLVKCLVMNGKLLVETLAEGTSQPLDLEIDIDDYVGENINGNYSAMYKNLEKLVNGLEKEVISKLCCSSSSTDPPSSVTSVTVEGSRHSGAGVTINEPRGPQIHPSGVVVPPVNPIGGSDLLPGPGAGMYPTRGGFGGDGGMLLGPNDPRWFGGVGGEHGFPGAQPGIPPGARFDPYGPPGVPGFEPSRFTRNPPRRPGGGIHPDLEHFGGGSDFI
ncbi:PROTEASOME REGULATOR1 [Hibiscus trionum]|uniref:PROTEASOME REGULATOR1 n=1 Tax=Hibiscus trionum TaxID=183268 RepID=A0A9W7H586_HIBTR|nr:PROTEASOME REGULATOR1 [Hibiscus trionum]